ncbi:hypothetical protein O6H91_17G002300 [Diphasiastrum complanatum]|uniref:Uncharacterized protein n=1 Tax=Diphasiastrum complanatum TaxID=34168 RepID=A0ACC2B3M9_DIPCM|nr:hypothetical protein O6H91_Y067200 [Diphasiastrum complanatum]KAJ7524378.1 hypothetical protein O6H91_17G002300 [Diphasiastrum complanatum]
MGEAFPGSKSKDQTDAVAESVAASEAKPANQTDSQGMISSQGESGLRRRSESIHSTSSQPKFPHLQNEQPPPKKGSLDPNLNWTIPASAPVHKRARESPLSSKAIFQQSHAGLSNLCIVILVAVKGRLIIENLKKYGLLSQASFWFSSMSAKDWPLLICGLSLPIFPILALVAEKLMASALISEGMVRLLHLVNCTVAILYPAYVIESVKSTPVPGFALIFLAITGWMKLVSYAHTNADIRQLALSGGEKPDIPADAQVVDYPDNITVANIGYFMVAPTLCYQLSYPRSPCVRKGWVLGQIGKLVVFLGLAAFIIEQYITPTIKNSEHPLKGNFLSSIERMLKLSIPTLYVWLCMFYVFFHLWFNILAELLRFGDREFYKDWWNAKTVEDYWRMWNMPVHRWLVRHIYFPCLRLGIPKHTTLIVVFTISGIFHEVVIGIPCHFFRCWAFLAIMLQVPLVLLTNWLQRKYQSSTMGNMIFWFFFCIVGQPMSILLYYHELVVKQQQALQVQ